MKNNGENYGVPAVSIVVPVYNAEKYLLKCVDSIRNQSLTNLEILLIDDGSTDDSGRICDELAKEDDRIRVIHQENAGASEARNRGIKEAKGDYIGFVDSDDYIDPDMYELLYNNIGKENAEIAFCSLYSCYTNKTVVACDSGYEVVSGVDMLGILLDGKKMRTSMCNVLCKRSLLPEKPFAKGRQYEDALLLSQMLVKVERVVVDYSPKYYYIHRSGSQTTEEYKRRNKEDILFVYGAILETVKEICPQYLELASFRLFWANYKVFDRMLMSDNPEAKEDKKEVKHYLRKHYFSIVKNKRVGKGRKIALTGLLLSENLYKLFVIQEQKHRNIY